VNHTRFPKEDQLPDCASRDNQVKKGDRVDQCFSTAGPRPGTGPWHQLYRAARGLTKLQYATRFH